MKPLKADFQEFLKNKKDDAAIFDRIPDELVYYYSLGTVPGAKMKINDILFSPKDTANYREEEATIKMSVAKGIKFLKPILEHAIESLPVLFTSYSLQEHLEDVHGLKMFAGPQALERDEDRIIWGKVIVPKDRLK